MNEQQMLEKYRGIMQFQTTVDFEEVDSLLENVVSLLELSFNSDEYMKMRKKAETDNNSSVVYYTKNKQDPRILVLVNFYGRHFCQVVIRFPEKLENSIRKLLQQIEMGNYENCLIQQSKMNSIVDEHQLDLDIVDEYNLWETTFKQKRFWYEYGLFTSDDMEDFDEDKVYPELVKPIPFEIAPESKFIISIGDTICQSSVFLDHPSLVEPYLLGWDDAARWHPHVLRWEEFEDIFLYLTICYPKDFVVPFLLMARFAPVTKEDNEKKIAQMMKSALRSLDLFTEDEIEMFDSLVAYKPHFTWEYEAEKELYHACNSPDDIYSMRHICTDKFPFQAFQDVLKSIGIHKNTKLWFEAKAKWDKLVQTYSLKEDEDWLKRREEYWENQD